MKNHNFSSLLIVTIIFLFFLFISFLFLRKITIYTYLSLTGIAIKEDQIMIMLENKKEAIEKGEYLYYRNKKFFYQIIEKKKEKHNYFYILSLSNNISEKETLSLSIPLEKKSLLYILCENWRLK